MNNSQGPNGWNPYDDFAVPDNSQPEYSPTQYIQSTPAEAPQKQGGNALGIVLGIAALCLVAVVGVIGGMVLAEQQPQNRAPVAAGDSSSSTSSTAEPTTVTETMTATATQSATSRSPEGRPSRTTSASSDSGMFSGPGIRGYLDQLDESGWKNSVARCSSGYYARNVALVPDGKVVICENHSQNRYYIGHFPNISDNPDGYGVVKYQSGYALAENGSTQYELTKDSLKVYSRGEEIASHRVVAFGTLNAG